jgi:predicted RNase H-like HicB family nuclease
MKIKAIIWQEDDIWCASVPALPGCHTWGENYDHLLEMLQDAVQGWLEANSQHPQNDILISPLLLKDLPQPTNFQELVQEIRQEAAANGLTPEILEELLANV